jgi:excisionase family DNA binding protein
MRHHVRMLKKATNLTSVTDDIPDRPLSPNELAQWLGTSRRFIEGQVQSGKLRARKISPRAVRFMRSDIAVWLASSSTTEE